LVRGYDFIALAQTMHEIWGDKRRGPVWEQRGLAILFVLVFVGPALFPASFAGSMIANFRTWLPEQIIPIVGEISFLVAILLDIDLFQVLYILLPQGSALWRALLPGAISAGLL
jgi:uncharacterized BrkB/YihY/UPF0761 family membrane protein